MFSRSPVAGCRLLTCFMLQSRSCGGVLKRAVAISPNAPDRTPDDDPEGVHTAAENLDLDLLKNMVKMCLKSEILTCPECAF